MKRLFECAVLAATLVCAVPVESLAQVRQSGNVTPTHVACWTAAGVIQDCGASTSPYPTTFGVRNGTGTDGICVQSDATTAAGYTRACLGTTTAGGAILGVSNFGTAPSPGFVFQINGTTVPIPVVSGSPAAGDAVCFLNTSGTLVDCGSPPISTLAHTHILVGNSSNIATDYGAFATFSDNGTLAIAPTASSTNRGISITQSGPSSGSTTATTGTNCTGGNPFLAYNYICIDAEGANLVTGSAPFFTYGLSVGLVTGGSNSTGNKIAAQVLLFHSAASAAVVSRDNIALAIHALSQASEGGTNTGAGAAGTLFAASFASTLQSGATNYFEVSLFEGDCGINTGGSAKHRMCAQVVDSGNVQGASNDFAFGVGAVNGAPGFKQAFSLVNTNGGAPIATTGCVICTDSSADTIATFADLSTYTISGNILNFANLTLTGAGTWTKTGYGSGTLISTSGAITALAGTTTTVLHGNAAGAPTFAAVSLTADITGTLAVGNGGTGATTFTANGVLYGNTTGVIQVTAQGAANSVLTANAGAPSFSATPNLNSFVIKAAGSAPTFECVSGTCAGFWFADAGHTTSQQIFFGADAAVSNLFRIGFFGTGGVSNNIVGVSGASGAQFVNIVGALGVNSSGYSTTPAANLEVSGTTASTSSTTGNIINRGGLGNVGVIFGGSDINATGNFIVVTAAKTLTLKQGANGAVGTFVCNGATPVTVNNTFVAISDAIIISLNTVGGTVGAAPDLKTITAATGFTVACTAADTSTYNYAIIKNAA